MDHPTILVTNDDGITAPGIRALVEVAKKFGDVVVVAPDKPQSGQGHAITINHPLRLRRADLFEGVEAYECSGTPVDCVKLAKNVLFKDRDIALCLSGINHGSNASINILYSGTMSAAMEASLEGIDSIGFSLLNYAFNADMTAAAHFAALIVGNVLKNGMGSGKLLNVNIPNVPVEQMSGIRVCKQGEGVWKEEFKEARDPRGEPYYWLTGKFESNGLEGDADVIWLEKNYVTVVPSMHDLTDYKALQKLNYLNQP